MTMKIARLATTWLADQTNTTYVRILPHGGGTALDETTVARRAAKLAAEHGVGEC